MERVLDELDGEEVILRLGEMLALRLKEAAKGLDLLRNSLKASTRSVVITAGNWWVRPFD